MGFAGASEFGNSGFEEDEYDPLEDEGHSSEDSDYVEPVTGEHYDICLCDELTNIGVGAGAVKRKMKRTTHDSSTHKRRRMIQSANTLQNSLDVPSDPAPTSSVCDREVNTNNKRWPEFHSNVEFRHMSRKTATLSKKLPWQHLE